jgi:hypothetical protein
VRTALAHLAWVVGPFETDAGAAAKRQQGLPEKLLFAIPVGLVARSRRGGPNAAAVSDMSTMTLSLGSFPLAAASLRFRHAGP